MIRIEVLYFDGCPNHGPAVERVRETLRELKLEASVAEVPIGDQATAVASGFLGSPSVRVDGEDVEPGARASREFGLQCRTYVEEGRRVGLPPREMLRAALREAAARG